MASKIISIRTSKRSSEYEITIGSGLLSGAGAWAARSIATGAKRVAVISNPTVFGLYGDALNASLKKSGFQVSTWLMKDGERHKSLRSLEAALGFLGESRLTRADAVLALGGGVVGDLAGFAASVYLRGIPFLEVPTTLLSMIDSSVGGKTGVNTKFGKNLVGSFYQPNGVFIDIGVLATLPSRELTAGFCEAVKQGAISGKRLFWQTGDFLERYRLKGRHLDLSDERVRSELAELIFSQVSFKARIVRQDEREALDRSDAKSRKILNFGHTFGHALEKVTGFRRFRHGEAVGYGIVFAAELSKILELLGQDELEWLNDVVHRAGQLPPLNGIDAKEVLDAFQFDKKLIAESIQWILLEKIGRPVILSGTEVPSSAVKQAVGKILSK